MGSTSNDFHFDEDVPWLTKSEDDDGGGRTRVVCQEEDKGLWLKCYASQCGGNGDWEKGDCRADFWPRGHTCDWDDICWDEETQVAEKRNKEKQNKEIQNREKQKTRTEQTEKQETKARQESNIEETNATPKSLSKTEVVVKTTEEGRDDAWQNQELSEFDLMIASLASSLTQESPPEDEIQTNKGETKEQESEAKCDVRHYSRQTEKLRPKSGEQAETNVGTCVVTQTPENKSVQETNAGLCLVAQTSENKCVEDKKNVIEHLSPKEPLTINRSPDANQQPAKNQQLSQSSLLMASLDFALRPNEEVLNQERENECVKTEETQTDEIRETVEIREPVTNFEVDDLEIDIVVTSAPGWLPVPGWFSASLPATAAAATVRDASDGDFFSFAATFVGKR